MDDVLFEEFVEIFELLFLDSVLMEVSSDVIRRIINNIELLLDLRNESGSKKYRSYKSCGIEKGWMVYSFLNPYLYSEKSFGFLRILGLIAELANYSCDGRILEISSLSKLNFLTKDRLNTLQMSYDLEGRYIEGTPYGVIIHESVLKKTIDINKIQSIGQTYARDSQVFIRIFPFRLQYIKIFLETGDHGRLLDILGILPQYVQLEICICKKAGSIGSLHKVLTKVKSCHIKSTFSVYDGDAVIIENGHKCEDWVIKHGIKTPDLSGDISRIKFVDDFYNVESAAEGNIRPEKLIEPFSLLKDRSSHIICYRFT